jgi:hypothetical protein
MFMQPQTKTNRSLGNAQSRLSAMPAAPAYGNTTNVNGAQTAITNPIRRPGIPGATNRVNPVRVTPEYMSAMGIEQEDPMTLTGGQTEAGGMPPQVPFSSAMQGNGQASYPGGDAPGIASYYRNSALQQYQGGQMVPNSPLQSNAVSGSAMLDDRSQSAAMRGLAGKIDAIRERSQIQNPMVPGSPSFGVTDIQAESNRRMAPMVARDAARQQNTPENGNTAFANDPNRVTPDQKADLARKSALAAAGGGAAADPTGMAARFGGAMGQQATADAEAIQNGQAVRLADGSVARFTGTPESAREAQNKGKVEREKLRDRSNMNVPQEELDRRKAADAAKKERADRHQAFRDQNNGMNYRQYDRFQKVRQSISRKVATGRMDPVTAELMLEQETNKAMRRAQGRRSAMDAPAAPQGRPLPLAAAPEQGPRNIPAQPPELAAQSVKTMAEQSPILKSLGITAESDLNALQTSVAGMKLDQMTSTQKYEAARHLHEFMLSQLESGNPAYQIGENAGQDGKDPRTSLIGLDALKTDNKDQMIQWLQDLHRQSNSSNKPANESPFGDALPIRTGA